jgi:hypothetical protein
MLGRLILAASALALFQTAGAVVVWSGAANDTAPSGQPHFDNVGTVGGGSAIYLGNGWVVTAAHVAGSLPASASFGGISYATEAGTFHRLENPTGSGLSTFTDIVLFRLGVHPGLPALTIASAAPTVASPAMMIGAGRSQESAPTYWEVTPVEGPANDIWTERPPENSSITHAGFETNSTRVLRWGENQIAAVNQTIGYGAGSVRSFFTYFNDGALTHEAQAVSGDSGGAVFTQVESSWVLSGMMVAVSTFENQPFGADTAVLGSATASADLSFYRNRILQVIPEPSAAALLFLGLTFLLRRRR